MVVELKHFQKAIANISKYGDNDTLPFDIDTRFIKDNQKELADLAFQFYEKNEQIIQNAIKSNDDKEIKKAHSTIAKNINDKSLFFERLLVPAGLSGFRTSTKIHPFWNIYFNGLGIAISEKLEKSRKQNAYSYRYKDDNSAEIFKRESSWRCYKEQTLKDNALNENAYVVQTDISNFYEHIYHHRIENFVNDLFSYSKGRSETSIGTQIDRLLSKFASGRSFGLPVGSQCSRVLAELFMNNIDSVLSDKGICWHRYVDDITLIAQNEHDAYKVLAELANVLANYGLALNKTKTIILSSTHYKNYVSVQLGLYEQGDSKALKEIDLYFDPYSDTAKEDYESLKGTVESLDIELLLSNELKKGQPDSFLISKISQTLELQESSEALNLLKTFLNSENLHAVRGSWSTIMRTVAKVRNNENFSGIFNEIDELLDSILEHSQHLLVAEANILFFLKAIKFLKTDQRAIYLNQIFSNTSSISIKKTCIECWGNWKDRGKYIDLRNSWDKLHTEEQKMLWLISKKFNDDGYYAQSQLMGTLDSSWGLRLKAGEDIFTKLYINWVKSNG